MLNLLFWFILFYVLFQFVFKFVVPLLTTTRQVRSKMKDMQATMQQYENNARANQAAPQNPKPEAKNTSKGDYIEFEEIK